MFEKHMPSGNDRAVSPVIGVVLMVGIVVALGAVVGAAVLGLGVGVGDTAPNAQFDASYANEDQTGDVVDVSVEHVAGDTVDGARLAVIGGNTSDPLSGELTAGNSATAIDVQLADDGEYDLRWQSENGETTSILATFDGPVDDDA